MWKTWNQTFLHLNERTFSMETVQQLSLEMVLTWMEQEQQQMKRVHRKCHVR